MSHSEPLAYLNHKLAKVSYELSEPDIAFDAFHAALTSTKSMIVDAPKSGVLNWNNINTDLLDDFSTFCRATNRKMNLESLRQSLAEFKEKFPQESTENIKIDLFNLRLRDADTDSEVIRTEFSNVISQTAKEHGNVSQEVQDIYADYVRFLHLRDADTEMATIIRDRLETLTPGHSDHLVGHKEKQPSTVTERIKRRITTDPETIARLSQLHAAGNAAYNEGDHDKAFKLHMEAATENYDQSEFSIGTFYQLGIGCDINMVQARRFYKLASEQGHVAAQHHYGALLQMGLGGEVDIHNAMHWYEEAAKSNYAPALMNLAAIYCTPLLGSTNYAVAIAYYLQAYELGTAAALESVFTYFGFPIDMFS